jgi:nonribosomal peptide synthetase DhbF
VLLLVVHHIAGDGWSLGPLAGDVERAYRARVEGKKPEWEPLRVQYGDYTQWQRELLGREEDPESVMAKQLEYWRKALAGMPEELMLPADRKRPAVMSYRGGTVGWELDEELHRGLVALAEEWSEFVHGAAGGVGSQGRGMGGGGRTQRSGRWREGMRRSWKSGGIVCEHGGVGRMYGDPRFSELIEQVRGKALEAYGTRKRRLSGCGGWNEFLSQARHPLFQVALVLQNAPEAKLELPGIRITEQRLPEVVAKFDLTFSVTEQVSGEGEARGLRGYIEYSADLFDRETVELLGARLERLLRAAVGSPEARVHELEILTAPERRQLLEEFNTSSEEQAEATIVELFEEQVRRRPEAVGLSFGQQRMSYAELDREANRLAHYLIAQGGVGPETLVGIALERSVEMVVAIVGTLKAGAGYLPLDPEYPRARLEQMLSDACPRVVVTTESLRRQLPQDSSTQFVCLDAGEIKASLALSPVHDPSDAERTMRLLPQHAAYVIYTSGSTGVPKGVVVTQQNVTRLFAATEKWFHFNEKDVWTLFHSYAFDFSVWEMWGALLYGGRLVVVEKSIARMPVEFLQLLVEEGVTVLSHAALWRGSGRQENEALRQRPGRHGGVWGRALE